MNVYLDNCIIVDIENNAIELSDLKLNSIDLQLVYSIAHLFEAKQKSNITDDFIIERCGLLHRLTNSSYVNYNHLKKHRNCSQVFFSTSLSTEFYLIFLIKITAFR